VKALRERPIEVEDLCAGKKDCSSLIKGGVNKKREEGEKEGSSTKVHIYPPLSEGGENRGFRWREEGVDRNAENKRWWYRD